MKQPLLLFLIGLLASCTSKPAVEPITIDTTDQVQPSLLGTWVQTIEGMEPEEQGFSLLDSAMATSVNMETLKYTHWKQQGDTLMLSGLSIGNGVSFTFTDTCRFQLTHTDTLVLQYSYGKQVFWRR
jgi:hypothetical protein